MNQGNMRDLMYPQVIVFSMQPLFMDDVDQVITHFLIWNGS